MFRNLQMLYKTRLTRAIVVTIDLMSQLNSSSLFMFTPINLEFVVKFSFLLIDFQLNIVNNNRLIENMIGSLLFVFMVSQFWIAQSASLFSSRLSCEIREGRFSQLRVTVVSSVNIVQFRLFETSAKFCMYIRNKFRPGILP